MSKELDMASFEIQAEIQIKLEEDNMVIKCMRQYIKVVKRAERDLEEAKEKLGLFKESTREEVYDVHARMQTQGYFRD